MKKSNTDKNWQSVALEATLKVLRGEEITKEEFEAMKKYSKYLK